LGGGCTRQAERWLNRARGAEVPTTAVFGTS
jgi:hypothetical protein